ncbi:MAG: PSD1 domain-containing protein, partial [Planctomycetaceae bacterium]|nr:PSD1 domain-containing protein [Planctomycetaceae bacterium]
MSGNATRFCLLQMLLLCFVPSQLTAQDSLANRKGVDFFEAKIRPMLVSHCYECHSAGAAAKNKLKAALFLDSRDGILRGGESGPAVVPGKPDESLLISALQHSDFKMPPKGKLEDEIIAHFVKWVEMGAPDPREGGEVVTSHRIDIDAGRTHWAFQPLASPVPPMVNDPSRVKTPVDQFILSRQESAGITPDQMAGPQTLIRRMYFDLIGLPPTPEQLVRHLERFEQDSESACEELVDELLASEHYGERWGRHWLDVARFAESNGYAFDGDRPNAWHYRDFVIQALNSDMPYNDFIREQLAGDLLADLNPSTASGAERSVNQLAATGFLVAGPYTTQQTQKERERSRYEQLDDIVNTLGTSLLGLTLGCSRCHDHKFDPLPQYDYYNLAACFADVGFSDTGINEHPEQFRELRAAYDAVHQPLIAARTKYEQEQLPAVFEQWLSNINESDSSAPAELTLSSWQHIGPFPSDNFDSAFSAVFPPERGIDLSATYKDGTLKWSEQPDWKDSEAHNDKLTGTNAANYLYRRIESDGLRVVSLSLGSDDGIKLWVNGREVLSKKVGRNVAAAGQETAVVQLAAGSNEVLMKVVNGGGATGFYFAASHAAQPQEIADIMAVAADQRNDQQKQKLFDWHKGFDREWLNLNTAVTQHSTEEPQPDLTQVFAARVRGTTYQFGEDTYKVYHLRRGNADNKEQEAAPGILRVLQASHTENSEREAVQAVQAGLLEVHENKSPRLALADWLTDTEQGAGALLARVIVNRLWYHHFGRGIVATPSDFGTRGESPTHPELLDWLAGELIRHNWQLKPIHRLIMMSSVYRQGTAVSESGARVDPDNMLLWRRVPRRMEAEVIRDSLLAVASELDDTMYGKGTLDLNNKRRSIY